MTTIKKGHLIPHPIENLQAIMAQDAIALEAAHKEIAMLRIQVSRLIDKLRKCRGRG